MSYELVRLVFFRAVNPFLDVFQCRTFVAELVFLVYFRHFLLQSLCLLVSDV